MRTRIRQNAAHHRRTKQRLTVSAFCHAIRSGRHDCARDIRWLRRRATGRYACGIPLVPVRNRRDARQNALSSRAIGYAEARSKHGQRY
jgi:hypothetical protein